MKRAILALILGIGGCETSKAPNVFVTESGLEYRIRVEFAIPTRYDTKYPFISRAFRDAALRWAQVVPIDLVLRSVRTNSRRVIDLYIVPGHPMTTPYGRYDKYNRLIILNSISLTTYQDAYDVALHEIGHAFGLQHVGDPDDIGGAIVSGMIVMLDNDVEKEQLMYPYLSDNNRGIGIGELDIELARLYIRNQLSW